jgi:putative multiple sugar transport system substrate-binding protein
MTLALGAMPILGQGIMQIEATVDPAITQYTPVQSVSGKFVIPGSDILADTASEWERAFHAFQPGSRLEYAPQLCKDAIQNLVQGRSGMIVSDRDLTPAEVAAFQKRFGYTPTRLPLCMDALIVFVNKGNPIDRISMEQLEAIYLDPAQTGSKQAVNRWSDLGVPPSNGLAGRPVTPYARQQGHSIRDWFSEAIASKGRFKAGIREKNDFLSLGEAVAADPSGIGFGSLETWYPRAKVIPITPFGDKTPQPPTQQAIDAGRYPVVRLLQIYLNRAPGVPLAPAYQEFTRFLLSRDGQASLAGTGFIPLPTEFVASAIRKLNDPGTRNLLEVGIVLPTQDEPRWLQDQARFQEALAGYNVEVLFSQNNPAKEKANVTTLIDQGAKVIILCPYNAEAAAASADEARKRGVKVVSYDRLIRGTASVDYYVTFDSVAVGEAWGNYLCARAKGAGNNLYFYAGAPSDNNSFMFFQGAWNVLQPRLADGTFVVRNSSEMAALMHKPQLSRDEMTRIISQVTTNWTATDAGAKAKADLAYNAAAMKGDVFICAPNDGTARAIADAFAADKDIKSCVITGQDAEKESVRYLLQGKQSMTVWKDVRRLVDDTIKLAVSLVKNQLPASRGTVNNGVIDVPAVESPVVTVDKGNLQEALFDSGFLKAADFQ